MRFGPHGGPPSPREYRPCPYGDDHFDLVAPGLRKGLPTFCDKPIGETPAGTRKILEFARQHKTPIMSSSLWLQADAPNWHAV